MKIKFLLMFSLVSAYSFCGAFSYDVAAWRGETVAVIVPDYEEFDAVSPEGISIRHGVLKPVRYAPEVGSLERREVLDRVDWSCSRGGVRVAEISVAPEAEPGEYTIGKMRLRVIDRVLPPSSEWRFYLDLWQHPWAVARMAGVKPFSAAHYRAMRPVWETLATAGQKALTVSLLEEPWDHQCRDAYHSMIGRVRHKDGTWTFDYAVFDQYVAFGRACGIGPDIACYTMCPWGYVVRWQDENGVRHQAVANPGTAAFDDFWTAFLEDFSRHLKEKGWFKDTLIAMDERSPEDVMKIAAFVQKHAPGMRISMAGNRKPSDFKGITIDSYAQVLRQKCLTPEFFAEAGVRRKQGYVTTFYVCCSPRTPNTFMFSGAGEAFWLGAAAPFLGLDGFLRWAWNSWPENPYEDASYSMWSSGDTFLAYPDGSPSWRFLELRNGIVAAEKVRILKEQGVKADEIDEVSKLFDVSRANDGTCDFKAIRTRVQQLVNSR